MKKLALCLLLVLAVSVPAGAKPGPKHITLYGTGNPAVDPGLLEAAFADVRSNGTVTLVGDFQLDGGILLLQRDHITIEGIALDNDGDGAVNEDWADGVDNDGDGAVDEDDWDASINGVLDGDGKPVDDLQAPSYEFFNRGLTLWGATEDMTKITVRNIKFFGLNRGIELGPEVLFQNGLRCADVEHTGGSVKHSVIEGNWFDNNERGFQVFGVSKDVTVQGNLFTNTVRAWALLTVADGALCFDEDGNPSSFPFGTPDRTTIVGNRLDGGEVGAILARGTNATVSGNTVDAFLRGMFISGANNLVESNLITNSATWAIWALEGGESTLITNNTIDGADFAVLFSAATGFTATNNATSNIVVADYFLEFDSANNTVRLLPGQTYIDNGSGNDIQ